MQVPVEQAPSHREGLRAHRAGDPWPLPVAARYDLHHTPRDALTWPRDVPVARMYFAILHSQLPFEIAKLRKNEPEAVRDFVTTWGLLGYERIKFKDQGRSFTVPGRPEEKEKLLQVKQDMEAARGGITAERFGYEPLAWVWAHAHGIRWILSVYKDLQARNADAVTSAVMDLPQAPTTSSRHLECAIAWDGPLQYKISLPINLQDLERMIRIIINHNLRGVSRMVADRPPDSPRFILFDFCALVQYAYWHLADVFDGGIGTARCQSCGYWFAQSDQRQRFCPPPPGQRSSRCGTRARMARLRARQDQVPEATP
ncbi:MAG TPA: hypothetical protein DGO43_09095 [Chloroflexi bacterium]|nr:hypothetical protein [Chloroflexota bacterium]